MTCRRFFAVRETVGPEWFIVASVDGVREPDQISDCNHPQSERRDLLLCSLQARQNPFCLLKEI